MNGGIDSLASDLERNRFRLAGKQLIDLFHTHHYQHELGIIDDELWETWVSQFDRDVQRKGFRELLRLQRPYLRPSFAAFVDEHMGENLSASP